VQFRLDFCNALLVDIQPNSRIRHPATSLTHWLVFTGREFRYEYNVKKNFTSAIATLNPFDLYSSAFVRPKTEENVNLEMNEPSDQHYCYRSHTAKFIPTIKNACIFSY